jgi:hypothetical protein
LFNSNRAGRSGTGQNIRLVCIDDKVSANNVKTHFTGLGAAHATDWKTFSKTNYKKHWSCHSTLHCDLDKPKLGGAFKTAANESSRIAHENGCTLVVYTVLLKAPKSSWEESTGGGSAPTEVSAPPPGSEGCAFAFVHNAKDFVIRTGFHNAAATGIHAGSRPPKQTGSGPKWIPIRVDAHDSHLPWEVVRTRRNSRVPKLLPHLFFPTAVWASVYIDSENTIWRPLKALVQGTLTDCGATFAAQAHSNRFTDVMREFQCIRDVGNTAEPNDLDVQEQAYLEDDEYMAAVSSGRAIGIDGELLVRRHHERDARHLNTAWMRAYLRGSDRDQPAFSYALEKSALAACRAQIGDACYGEGRCGLACGQGPMNLVASGRSADCLGKDVDSYCEGDWQGYCDVKPRPAWSTPPPAWVCDSDFKRRTLRDNLAVRVARSVAEEHERITAESEKAANEAAAEAKQAFSEAKAAVAKAKAVRGNHPTTNGKHPR